MAVITYEDVSVAIGRPISDTDEQQQVGQWIDDVEMLIGARLGDVSLLDQGLLAYVVRETVIERMRYRSEDGNDSDNTDNGREHYFLQVLDPWWALLSPSKTGSGAFSVRPFFEPDDVDPMESWA